MKKFATRGVTAVALTFTLVVSAPAVAFASSPPASGTTAKAPTPWTTWHASWVTFINEIKTINQSYQASLHSARSAYAASMSVAVTAAERQAARTTLTNAVIAAIDLRVSLITAAGVPPAPPAGYNGTAFIDGFQAAHIAFRAALASAQSAFAGAIQNATTPAQRATARANLKSAISAAVIARSNALSALGSKPSKPGQPTG